MIIVMVMMIPIFMIVFCSFPETHNDHDNINVEKTYNGPEHDNSNNNDINTKRLIDTLYIYIHYLYIHTNYLSIYISIYLSIHPSIYLSI